MTSLRLHLPCAFNFHIPDEWLRWKKCFEQFRVEDADDTITRTHITVDECKQYQAMIVKRTGLIQVRPNVIFEWVKFNRRVQREGELVEQFITSLYNLVETCHFEDLKNEMIRDRIIVGIWNQALSEHLQTVADLTLEKVKTLVRQREAAHEHQLTLNGSLKVDKSLDSVQKQAFNSRGKSHFPKKGKSASKGPTAVVVVLVQDTCALQKTLSVTSATSEGTTVHSAFRSQSERSAIRQSPWTTLPFWTPLVQTGTPSGHAPSQSVGRTHWSRSHGRLREVC